MAKFVENAAEEVLAAAKELLERGLVEGTSGNISARQEDGTIAVTVKALQGRGAALIANHGMVAVAPTMAKAMHNTALVERSATIIWGARQLGPIHPLPEKVDRDFGNVYEYLRTL